MKYQTAFPFDAHTASRVRCTAMDVLSLSLNKERTKENQPRGLIPLGTPERKKVAPLSLCSSFREVMQPQLLRLRVEGTRKHGSSTQRAKADLFAVCDALRFN